MVGAQSYRYTLRRSRRARNLLLHVALDGVIEVVVPWHVAYREAQQFVRAETAWLRWALAKNQRLHMAVPQRRLVSGEMLPVLGEIAQLEVFIDPGRRRSRYREEAGIIRVAAKDANGIRRAVVGWYKTKARRYFLECTQRFAEKLGVRVSAVTVSDAATQWGSCIQDRGRISLQWRLLLGPRPVADYVIAHEVAHLRVRSHSASFWRLVASLDQDCDVHRAWLRKNGYTLVL
jgi:predicted metal-dependent hydrolase